MIFVFGCSSFVVLLVVLRFSVFLIRHSFLVLSGLFRLQLGFLVDFRDVSRFAI